MAKKMMIAAGTLVALAVIGSQMPDDTEAADTTSAAPSKADKPKADKSVEEVVEEVVEEKPEPEFSVAQLAAIRSAQSYVDTMPFSRAGLIDQMTSEYGSQYKMPVAVFAVNHIDVDWNAEAVEAAESYLSTMGYSRAGLIDQMTSAYGSQFTEQQAVYAVNKVGL